MERRRQDAALGPEWTELAEALAGVEGVNHTGIATVPGTDVSGINVWCANGRYFSIGKERDEVEWSLTLTTLVRSERGEIVGDLCNLWDGSPVLMDQTADSVISLVRMVARDGGPRVGP